MLQDRDRVVEQPDNWAAPREWIFGAGQSKRIWNELYKVVYTELIYQE
jgi:nuclear GTP-binding protein